MGKPSSFCVGDQLERMSGDDAKRTPAPDDSEMAPGPPPIPKLYIPKSLLKKPKMVDNIMRRLSIDPGHHESAAATDGRAVEFASKVFRKRAHSSGQHGYDVVPKIQVIDNSTTVPGMLPTPVVPCSSSIGGNAMSVFKSETCDSVLRKFMKEEIVLPEMKTKPSRAPSTSSGLVVAQSSRPMVRTPPVNDFYRRPRTVAEKRLYLEQSPLEYRVLDFENTVYHLVKKFERFKDDATFRTQVELLLYATVPTTRSIWKALLCLNRDMGNGFLWQMYIDGERVRLLGATRTCVDEYMVPVSSRVDGNEISTKVSFKCCADSRQRLYKLKNEADILVQLEKLRGSTSRSTNNVLPPKLITKRTASMAHLRPGPLSSKVRRLEALNTHQSHLGPLEIYELPQKNLCVVPEINKRQSTNVCSYLKLFQPEDNLTEEWLNFSLAVLKAPPKDDAPVEVPSEKAKFKFPIPYKNNQTKILVRRMYNRKRGDWRTEDHDEQMRHPLTFPAVAREMCERTGEVVDPEAERILTEMIESVALSYSEDFFIHNDPDLTYRNDCMPPPVMMNKKGPSETMARSIKKRRPSEWSRFRAELRRLNVAIIDAENIPKNETCTKEECKLGCVCDSLSHLENLVNHCNKEECMFQCQCPRRVGGPKGDEEWQLRRMRDEKIRSLAPQEKEFVSTLVLTDSNTILVSNSEDRRRARVKPKRFTDYQGPAETFDTEREEATEAAKPPCRRKEMCHIEIERLQHCAVELPVMPGLEGIETWCMIHEMYRCFCGNKRIEGKPFKLVCAPDGSVSSNVKESILLNGRRRQVSFAKHESQNALERLPVRPREDGYCSRCTPRDFSAQFQKNRENAEVVRTKTKLSERKHKAVRLQMLIDQCHAMDSYSEPPGPKRRSMSTNVEEKSRRICESLIQEVKNDLGLKISSVRTMEEGDDYLMPGIDEEEDGGGGDEQIRLHGVAKDLSETFKTKLSNLKRKLLSKLHWILESMSKAILHPSNNAKALSFVRYKVFKKMLEGNMLIYEVRKSPSSDTDAIILAKDSSNVRKSIPSMYLQSINHINDCKLYLSKFLTSNTTKMQSSSIFVILESSGSNYWIVRGCQYIKDVEGRIRITTEHSAKLRSYAQRETQSQSNLDVWQMHLPGDGQLNVSLPAKDNERWMMMNLRDDFSDLGHRQWKGLLSYKHIKMAIDMAQRDLKTICVIRNVDRPNVYAVPHYPSSIFLGPFAENEANGVHLYQRMDNSLLLREEYEKVAKVARKEHTTGYWLTSSQLNAEADAQSQRRLSSAAAGSESPEPPPNFLPELSLCSATIKQEGVTAEPPAPVVFITATTPSPSQRSLLRPPAPAPEQSEEPPSPQSEDSLPPKDFQDIHQLLKNREVTFRMGNAEQPSREELPSVSVIKLGSEAPAAAAEVADYESEDDDVVLIEQPDEKIIDLDEWERVQREMSDEEKEAEVHVEPLEPVLESESPSEVAEDPEAQKTNTATTNLTVFEESMPYSGYFESNIVSLGRIPAKILDGIATINLPFRKVAVRIPVDNVNQYMWNYIQNSVSVCFPQDLKVTWSFVQSFFPNQDTVFKLEPGKQRNYQILTPYGVINVLSGMKTEEDIPDPTVYLKYLASRLCALVFDKLGVYSANLIIDETLQAIKRERYEILRNTRERKELLAVKSRLMARLEELQLQAEDPTEDKNSKPGTSSRSENKHCE